jgi:hypothetical protein
MEMASGNPWGFFVMDVIITPHKLTSTGMRYTAHLNGRLLCVSRTPFFAAARVLQREGVPGRVVITMRHKGSPHESMRSTIAEAVGHRVRETETDGPVIVVYNPATDSPAVTPRVA